LRAIAEEFAECGGESVHIATGKNITGQAGADKFETPTNLIADDNWTAAEQRLTDYDRTRIVLRRKNKEVGGGVYGGKLRLVGEAEETNVKGNAQRGSLGFELRTQWAITGKDQNGIRNFRLGKRAQEIEGALPRLEFGAEQNHLLMAGDGP
jgi:hypothetical protein